MKDDLCRDREPSEKSECFEEYKSSDEYKIYVNKDKTRYACVYYSLFGEKEEEFIEDLRNIKEEKYLLPSK